MFWFRRDLRIEDNHGFYRALQGENKVIPIFIFDSNILDKLPKKDARVEFILSALSKIDIAMKSNQCSLGIYHGTPEVFLKKYSKNGLLIRLYVTKIMSHMLQSEIKKFRYYLTKME